MLIKFELWFYLLELKNYDRRFFALQKAKKQNAFNQGEKSNAISQCDCLFALVYSLNIYIIS